MTSFVSKIGKLVPNRVKQLFGAAGLKYGLRGVDDSNKWSGSDTPAGRRSSSIVDACSNLLVDALTSCRPIVLDQNGNEVENHPIIQWITYDFMAGLVRNGVFSGNCIAFINETEDLVADGLVVLPSYKVDIERKGNTINGENVYLHHDIDNETYTYTQDQVFHFRYQVDPDRPWIGRSPLTNVDNDLLLDIRITSYASGFMRRFGVPGWIAWPEGGRPFTAEERKQLRADITANFLGENSGGFAVGGQKVGITQLQGPRQFIDLGDVRTQPEFRVCGQLGCPPVLATLPAGYRFTTANATLKEIRRHFADATVKPLMDSLGDALTKQVLDRNGEPSGLRVSFAYQESYLFARDLDAESARVQLMGPYITIDEARAEMGKDPIGDERGDQLVMSMGQQQNQETEPQGASNQML